MIKRVPARVARERDTYVVEVPLCTVVVRYVDLDRARVTARGLVLDFLRREHNAGRLLHVDETLPPGFGWEWLVLEVPEAQGPMDRPTPAPDLAELKALHEPQLPEEPAS